MGANGNGAKNVGGGIMFDNCMGLKRKTSETPSNLGVYMLYAPQPKIFGLFCFLREGSRTKAPTKSEDL